MKNVLLTTTALVAFAGTAFAAGHDAGSPLSFSGDTDIGYNDVLEGGLFVSSDFTIAGTVDLGDSIVATISYGLVVETSNGASNIAGDDFPTIEITSPFGSLKAGELDEEGASEYFYADRDGMSGDLETHDSDTEMGVRALVEYSQFGLAIGGEIQSGSNDLDGLNIGVGTTLSQFTFGLGYDEKDALDTGGDSFAVSVDAEFDALTVGLSYFDGYVDTVDDGNEDSSVESIGVDATYAISSDLSVSAYYASNTGLINDGSNVAVAAVDSYGLSAEYTATSFTIGAYYDHTDLNVDEYGLDASYNVNSDITAYVGVFDNGTTEYYVGAEYTINDSISATVSYATADEISGPEFKDGTSVFLTVSF